MQYHILFIEWVVLNLCDFLRKEEEEVTLGLVNVESPMEGGRNGGP